MVAEEIVITLSGGAPWGFRLQGGAEHKKPLQVAKVRRRSKACRAGLREADELLSINETSCGELSHAQAMNLIDGGPGILHIRVKRSPSAFQSMVLLGRTPSPRIDKEYRSALRAPMSPPGGDEPLPPRRERVMSPPDSEAYYGETDSDADTVYERQRRQKRRSPSGSPAKMPGREESPEEETSEMSGYESAPDARPYPIAPAMMGGGGVQQDVRPGVARREVVYQPPRLENSPENSPENSSGSTGDHSPVDGQGSNEVDSGFQEPPSLPPLVSPDRAKEALLLPSRRQLVPMVGPVDNPVDEELTVTYKDKARQAKLHRSESGQDRQVKEARSKCRSIAALLTDAPNPHSKGVLMFKKRRQRAKKYTLTCFGSVEGDPQQNGSPGGEEEEEEEGVFPGSESELDEDGFTSAPESAWDSDYLDILERKTPTSAPAGFGDGGSPGLNETSGRGAQLFEQQRKRAEEHAERAGVAAWPALQSQQVETPPKQDPVSIPPMTPHRPVTPVSYNMMNGESAVVSRASIVMSPPGVALAPTGPAAPPAGSVLNRTAQPFGAGPILHRAATTPVVFRPNITKKTPPQPAVTTATAPPSEVKRAVSTTSLYIPPRPATRSGPTSVFSPPSSVAAAPFCPPPAPATPFSPTYAPTTPFSAPATPFSPTSAPVAPYSSPAMPRMSSQPPTPATSFPPPPHPAMPFSQPPTPSTPFPPPPPPATPFSAPPTPGTPFPPPPPPATPFSAPPTPAPKVSFSPYVTVASTPSPPAPATPTPSAPQYPAVTPAEPLASREQRIAVPAARTGILQDARRRGARKPMFSRPEEKKGTSPNPELLSLVQNLDERPRAEAGFESGPEEDSLNLGAEACNFMQAQRSRPPPPVAPKPHAAPEGPQIPQMGGKGAELFARRQSRMDRYVVDRAAPPTQPPPPSQPRQPSPTPSLPAHWKYSPNIRAPPPIGYNPLLSPSCPPGAQRGTRASEASGAKKNGAQKQAARAVDVMSRQPYQLNSAMFSYGGSQPQSSSLTPPRQIPVKAARVYNIKRFSTPTPMSAPSCLTPSVIAPRSATTLGEPFWRSDITSPPPTPLSPPPAPAPAGGLPELPKIYSAPIPNPVTVPPSPFQAQPPGYAPLQSTKQFKSAPELSPLSQTPLRSSVSGSSPAIRVPRPRFSASSMGIQANVWRPGGLHC
ncbi:synaptopodin 2-like protein [Megalops cyprinoides]|uniref:synaptopodin 2-like protein n=1 Tax=Megalops cyprinoides TaxID=118141 RepID=UPI00186516C2|nr:synaptopodin 2-like protein [Megalops cyprinoides]